MITNPLLIDRQIISSFPYPFLFAEGRTFHGMCGPGIPGMPGPSLPGLNSQSFPPFCPAAIEDESSSFGGHADQESMGPFPARVAHGFQCLFHRLSSLS